MKKLILIFAAVVLSVCGPATIRVSAQIPNTAKKGMVVPNQTVYISTNAPYYHRMGCGYLKKGRTMPIMLYDACKLYEPCPSCNPPVCINQ